MRRCADPSEPTARRREVATFAAALAGHVAVLVLAFGMRDRPLPTEDDGAAAQGQIDALIEIDLRTSPPESPQPPSPSTTREPEPSPAVRESGIAARETTPDLPAPTAPEPTTPEAAPSAAPSAPDGEYSGTVAVVPIPGHGLSFGTPVWAIPGGLPAGPDVPGPGGAGTGKATGPLPPKAGVAPGRGATVLKETLAARDRELGLGNPGATTVMNAVTGAVHASSTPSEATAVLVARVGGDGVVLSIGVHSFSAGDTKTWNAVAKAAAAAIGKKKLVLAGLGPKGALVQVRVSSGVRLPSGTTKPAHGILPSLTGGPPRDVAPAQGPDGDACAPERRPDGNTLCGVGAKVAGFDVADALAGRHRQVSATFQITLLDDALALATPPRATVTPAAPPAPTPSVPPAKDAGAP
ncbi:MAG: hypothetical protein R3F14_27905 [Polyangiaceae bacterium]